MSLLSPKEFAPTILSVIWVPRQANAKVALDELYTILLRHQTLMFIIVSDFTQAIISNKLSKYHHNVSYAKKDVTLCTTIKYIMYWCCS